MRRAIFPSFLAVLLAFPTGSTAKAEATHKNTDGVAVWRSVPQPVAVLTIASNGKTRRGFF